MYRVITTDPTATSLDISLDKSRSCCVKMRYFGMHFLVSLLKSCLKMPLILLFVFV